MIARLIRIRKIFRPNNYPGLCLPLLRRSRNEDEVQDGARCVSVEMALSPSGEPTSLIVPVWFPSEVAELNIDAVPGQA